MQVWLLASGLVSFTLSFFLTQSYAFWRSVYSLTRQVQGRLNDIGLLCSAHAQRGADGTLTSEAAELLDATARNLRLLHCLFYADLCYRKVVRAGSQTATASVLASVSSVHCRYDQPACWLAHHAQIDCDLQPKPAHGSGQTHLRLMQRPSTVMPRGPRHM